eukprot:3317630-Pyramimonas_sp.AAC.1
MEVQEGVAEGAGRKLDMRHNGKCRPRPCNCNRTYSAQVPGDTFGLYSTNQRRQIQEQLDWTTLSSRDTPPFQHPKGQEP